ncbi:MAG: hypothetical protein IKP31_01360 [Lachnospiraceae bacterium]|nr:hypothetical protein [Lachnospiraceae bacterium]
MEEKLRRLFDFQRFIVNEDLQEVIDSVEARHTKAMLTDDELDYVAAAGDPYLVEQSKINL